MKVTYIELLGEKHPLCFSLAAQEALEETFGGLDAMSEEFASGESRRIISAVDKALQILMKAGRVYLSARGEELPAPLPCRPADLIGAGEKEKIKTIFQAIAADTEREVEVEIKNGEATPGE